MDETKSNDVNRYERKLRMCNLIAKPMASEKLTYKLLKITKRGNAQKIVFITYFNKINKRIPLL